MLSGFAETVYGTVNYYRDYGVNGNNSIPLKSLGNTTAKSKELLHGYPVLTDLTCRILIKPKYNIAMTHTTKIFQELIPIGSQKQRLRVNQWSLTHNAIPQDLPLHLPHLKALCLISKRDFIRIINEYRATLILQPLKASKTLSMAASWMAEDMAKLHKLSHTDSLNRNPAVRAEIFRIS